MRRHVRLATLRLARFRGYARTLREAGHQEAAVLMHAAVCALGQWAAMSSCSPATAAAYARGQAGYLRWVAMLTEDETAAEVAEILTEMWLQMAGDAERGGHNSPDAGLAHMPQKSPKSGVDVHPHQPQLRPTQTC